MQTNKISGENTLALLQGRKPPHDLIGFGHGSLNQKAEAAEVQIGYYCLFAPDEKLGAEAIDYAIGLLENQERDGFMGQEVWTDSHWPIWARALSATLLWCLRISTGKLPTAGTKRAPELRTKVERWWELQYTSCQLGYVPGGPLAGHVILPCNRKASDEVRGVAGGVLSPDDLVRRAWFAMMNGQKPKVGKNFFDLSIDRPDTMAGPITRLVLASGGFGPTLKRGTAPKLCAPCEVERYADGHVVTFPGGLPEANQWSAPACYVVYSSGEYGFQAITGEWYGPGDKPVGKPPGFQGAGRVTRLAVAEQA